MSDRCELGGNTSGSVGFSVVQVFRYGDLKAYPVRRLGNSLKNDDSRCIDPDHITIPPALIN